MDALEMLKLRKLHRFACDDIAKTGRDALKRKNPMLGEIAANYLTLIANSDIAMIPKIYDAWLVTVQACGKGVK